MEMLKNDFNYIGLINKSAISGQLNFKREKF